MMSDTGKNEGHNYDEPDLKRQKKLHKRGIYNYIRICDFIKIEKYSIYGIVRDSQNLQLSCIQQKMC